jgi:catechol 2,3-dioxygenase-like lactoylglutathione lyase family enzyme
MAVRIDHLALAAHDARESARFLADILGLPAPYEAGPFLAVDVDETFTIDYAAPPIDFPGQHVAFLVGEDEFDEIFGRIRERGLEHWADPGQSRPASINHNDGGRGVYFEDPDGHLLEIITRPYGSGS